MSIIHDALKKAEGGNNGRPTATSATPNVRIGRPNNGFNIGLLFIVTVLLVAGALALAPLTNSSRLGRQPHSPEVTPNAVTVISSSSTGVSGQFGIEEMPRTVPFQLSGVVVGSDRSYGIINNQIVMPGQQVSGATVRSISGKEVELDYQGQKVVLEVSGSNSL